MRYPATPERKPRRRWLRKTILTVMLVLVAALGVVFALLRSEPTHWKEHQAFLEQTSPDEMKRLAEGVEQELAILAESIDLGRSVFPDSRRSPASRQGDAKDSPNSTQINATPSEGKPLSEVRIDASRTLRLTEPQLKALVLERFDEWMSQRGYVKPDEVTEPMVGLKGGGFVLAFRLATPHFTQILSAQFDVAIQADGMALMKMDQFQAGRLPIPAHSIGEWIRSKAPGDQRLAKIGDWLGKLEDFEFKPVFELENRRRARVESFAVHGRTVELTVRVQDHRTYRQANEAFAVVPTN